MMTLLPLCLLACTALAAGQTPAKPTFDIDLSMPDVPAFTILGVSPTQIERPTTPKALALSLLSATSDGSTLIPSRYAIVVAPYWMQHPAATLDEYVRPTVKQSLMQTFTASFATARSPSTTSATTNSTDMSAGFAGSLWAGHGSAAFAGKLALVLALDAKLLAADGLSEDVSEIVTSHALDATLGTSPSKAELRRFLDGPSPASLKAFLRVRYTERFNGVALDAKAVALVDAAELTNNKTDALKAAVRVLETAVDTLFAADPLPILAGPVGDLLRHVPEAPSDAAALHAAREIVAYRSLSQVAVSVKALNAATESAVKATVGDVQSEDKQRVGWMLALSGAIGSRVPDARFADARRLRWGVWASPSYRGEASHVEIIGVLKWIQRSASEGPNLVDAGARLVKQAGNASLSAEYLERVEQSSSASSAATERTTINFDYKIADKVFLTAAFGKDFADPTAGRTKGGLLSVLGVSLGLSKSPSVQVP